MFSMWVIISLSISALSTVFSICTFFRASFDFL